MQANLIIKSDEKDVDVQLTVPGEQTFLERQISSNPHMLAHARLFREYFDSPLPREDIAERERLPIGSLLQIFNETAPLSPPLSYSFGGTALALHSMPGLCDDFYGIRFGKFGTPLTLRFYLTEEAGIPPEFFEVADWNFMDGGLPYFVAYAYGTRFETQLFLSGLQSDVAQRYTYLFLGRGGGTDVREGLEKRFRQTDDLKKRFGRFVPRFRKVFQRQWIDIVLAGIFCYLLREGDIRGVALQQFRLEDEEKAQGHIVNRLYRGFPAKLAGLKQSVATECNCYYYHFVD